MHHQGVSTRDLRPAGGAHREFSRGGNSLRHPADAAHHAATGAGANLHLAGTVLHVAVLSGGGGTPGVWSRRSAIAALHGGRAMGRVVLRHVLRGMLRLLLRATADGARAFLAGTAVLAQLVPLPEEEELEVAVRGDGGREPLAPRGERLWVARPRARLPAAPDALAMVLLERHEEREIVQPRGIGLAEGGKRGVARTGEEAAGNPFQHTHLPRNHAGEVYLVVR